MVHFSFVKRERECAVWVFKLLMCYVQIYLNLKIHVAINAL